MEVVHLRCGEDDFISNMPDNVIANIMDRLPLIDAVATSILSPSWRFKWTLLTQLILDDNFFRSLLRRKVHFDKTIISKLFVHLKVTNCDLTVTDDIKLEDEDIHHWVMFVFKIPGLTKFTLLNCRDCETPVKLPTHIFSCLDLKHLQLQLCVFPPFIRGFPKLLTLDFYDVTIQDHKYGDLIAECPLLETLMIWDGHLRVKLVEIAKLKNLKVLGLLLCLLDIHMTMVSLSTILQHMSLLPNLQELWLDFKNCKFLPEDVAQNPVSTTFTFPFLKELTFSPMDFSSVSMLSCAFGMIFGCTNLQTLFINAIYLSNVVPLPAIFPPELDCSTMGKLQLQNVRLADIKGLENEVCLIKYILACSPMLQSILILPDSSIFSNGFETYKLASNLLKLHRASPIAEVIF